jgi:ATP-dependent protease ClpP protease subunit
LPNWNDVFKAINNSLKNGSPEAVDVYRHKALKKLFDKTGRNTIAYYSGWLSKPGIQMLDINDEDMNGFMNAVNGLDKSLGLDLILHTPGGSIATTESLVNYLHLMFDKNMLVIVPQVAMSAGTMIACSSRQIILGKQSSLGPIDPQMRNLAAQGVLNEFKRALEQIKLDPDAIQVWRCILQQYHPTFLGQCQQAIDWTKQFVADQLRQVMFENDPEADAKALRIVDGLSDADTHKSHDRHIPFAKCKDLGLNVLALEDDNELQELVLTVHHCYMYVMMNTATFKIIENHKGSAFSKAQQMQIQLQPGTAIPAMQKRR